MLFAFLSDREKSTRIDSRRHNDSMEEIETTIRNLVRNGFLVSFVPSAEDARRLFFSEIWPSISPSVVSYGYSLTLAQTGIIAEIEKIKDIQCIFPFGGNFTREQKRERRRLAFTSDLFLSGSNAITEDGKIINLDMVGNRVSSIGYGPRKVALTIGVNKICKNLEEGMRRVKTVSAPLNAARHTNLHTPCKALGRCVECDSNDRICNQWSIIERCYPRGRIHIILIDQPLGL